MSLIIATPEGNISVGGILITVGLLWARPNSNKSQAAISFLDGTKSDLVAMKPVTEYSGSGGAFTDYADMMSDLDGFFFKKTAVKLADGDVFDRNALPVTIPPNAGAIFIVRNPVTVTVMFIPFVQYQSGLYIRDTENGDLNDWRRLNIKTDFLHTELKVHDPSDTSKFFTLNASLQTPGAPSEHTLQAKDGTLAHLDDIGTGNRLSFKYRATVTTQTPPPATGRAMWDESIQEDSNNLFFNKTTDGNSFIEKILLTLVKVGAEIILFSESNTNNFQHWNISAITDGGTDVRYAVDHLDGTYNFSQSERMIVTFIIEAAEGADEFPHVIKVDPLLPVHTGEQYTTIPPAVDFANAAASPSTPYLIILGAAVHPLDTAIALQANVHMIGGEASSTIIQVNDSLQGSIIIDLQASNSLRKITILGSSTLKSTAGTYAVSSTTEGSYFLEDVTIDLFNRGISFTHTSSGGSFQVLQIINHARIRECFIGMFLDNTAEVVIDYANFVENDTSISSNGESNLIYKGGRIVSRAVGTGIGINIIGNGTLQINALLLQDLAEGIIFNGVGTTYLNSIRFDNCTIETTTNAAANIIINNTILERTKLIFNVNPKIEGMLTSLQPGLNEIFSASNFAVGLANKGVNFAAGEGGAYLQGMLVYTEDTSNVFVNVTDDAVSPTGSTLTFPGTAADNRIYISTNIDDAIDFKKFFGVVLNLESIADYGAGAIELQYFNGVSFVTVAMMGRDNGNPHLSSGELVFGASTLLSRDVYFNSRIDTDWTKNDPPTTGIDRFWVRFNITSAITTLPIIEQIFINPSHFNVKGDGFTTFHGKARPLIDMAIDQNEFQSSGFSPGNQDLFRSDTVSVGRIENSFANGVTDRIGTIKVLPDSIDTSVPVVISWTVAVENASGGDIRWVIRIDKSNDSNNRAVFFSTGGAPSSSATQEDFVLITEAPSAGELQITYSIELSLNTFIPRRLDSAGDDWWLIIERTGGDAADTHTSDANFIRIRIQYTSWAAGGFDTNIQFSLAIPIIQPPSPPSQTVENELFEHQATATGGGIIWSLANAPVGMTISINGLISWTPTVVGANLNIEIIATNDFGSDTELFDLEVIANPIPQAQLIGDWHAKDLTLNDTDPVANWVDDSPIGANMTQGTGSAQPTFLLNQVNGLPAVSGNGGDTMHNFQVNIPPHTTFGNTIIIVAASTQATQAGMVSQQSVSGGGNQTFFYLNRFTTGAFIATFDSSSSNNNAGHEVSGSFNDGAFHIFTASHNATDTFLRVDTVNTNTFSESVSQFTIEDMHLFNNGSGAGTFFFNGLIARALFWNRQLTSGELDAVETSLRTEFNTP